MSVLFGLLRRGAPLALLAATALAFLTAFGGAFQFDDYNVIVDNPWVHSWAAWADSMPGMRPLLKASYTLNWTLAPAPLGFVLVNVAVHAANVLLVYALLVHLFDRVRGAGDERAHRAAFIAALLFAVHTVNTEAVTYVSGRSVSLMATFYLASLLAYVRGCEAGGRSGWLRMHALSPLLFLGAMGVKETAVTLPLALLLWDAIALRIDPREHHAARPTFAMRVQGLLRRHWTHWLVLAAALGAMAAVDRYHELVAASFAERGVVANLLTQANAIFYLLGQLVLPWRVDIDPQLPVITTWDGPTLAQVAALLAAIAAGFALVRRAPLVAFGLLWFFLHLLPTNSIVPRLDIANDRQLYLAAIGLFVIAAVAVERVARAKANWVVGSIVLALGIVTAVRNLDYRSEIALWQDTVRKSPGKSRAWHNLGYAYEQAGSYTEAERAYERALKLQPDNWQAQLNLDILRRAFAGGLVPPPVPDN